MNFTLNLIHSIVVGWSDQTLDQYIVMDVCPSVDELETYVTLTSNNKIKKLAEQLGVPVSRRHLQNLKEEKLRHVFQQWLESKNAFATRHGMIEALQAINEHDMAKTYLDSITSYLKSKS